MPGFAPVAAFPIGAGPLAPLASFTLDAELGTFALTGYAVNFSRTYVMAPDVGAFNLTGYDAGLFVYGVPAYFPLLGWVRDADVPAYGAMSSQLVAVESDWVEPFAILGWLRSSKVYAEGDVSDSIIALEGELV